MRGRHFYTKQYILLYCSTYVCRLNKFQHIVFQITDHRQIVTPGGKTVQQLIGNAPLIIKHEKRVNAQPAGYQSIVNETVSDTSIASGDISIQAVFDVRRNRLHQ